MTFVPGEKGSKLAPKNVAFTEYRKFAKSGMTIPDVAKVKGIFESGLRLHLNNNYPELYKQYRENQLEKYKKTRERTEARGEVYRDRKGKAEVLPNHYQRVIKDYTDAIACDSCALIIAHAMEIDIPERLKECPRCHSETIRIKTRETKYLEMSKLKINQTASQD